MTIAELVEQAKALSPQEREELIQQLTSLQTTDVKQASDGHWGQQLNQLRDKLGTIDMLYPEIEDPVEWVQQVRADEQKRRLGNWGDDE